MILPHLCAAKSPQAVAGTLVKKLFCARKGLDPARVYHVAIMPCFDKKLEASRDDFSFSSGDGDEEQNGSVSETDCVLTTSEVHELLRERGEALQAQPRGALDAWDGGEEAAQGSGLRGVRGGSGGYLEYCLKFAARELHGVVRFSCGKSILPALFCALLRPEELRCSHLSVARAHCGSSTYDASVR